MILFNLLLFSLISQLFEISRTSPLLPLNSISRITFNHPYFSFSLLPLHLLILLSLFLQSLKLAHLNLFYLVLSIIWKPLLYTTSYMLISYFVFSSQSTHPPKSILISVILILCSINLHIYCPIF